MTGGSAGEGKARSAPGEGECLERPAVTKGLCLLATEKERHVWGHHLDLLPISRRLWFKVPMTSGEISTDVHYEWQ